jgi:hypothetical protein
MLKTRNEISVKKFFTVKLYLNVSFQITALKIKYNPFAKAFQDSKERYVLRKITIAQYEMKHKTILIIQYNCDRAEQVDSSLFNGGCSMDTEFSQGTF